MGRPTGLMGLFDQLLTKAGEAKRQEWKVGDRARIEFIGFCNPPAPKPEEPVVELIEKLKHGSWRCRHADGSTEVVHAVALRKP